jgi:hypothetical protein
MSALRRLGNDAVQLLHLGGTADDGAKAMLGAQALAQDTLFGGQLELVHRALQHDAQFVEGERFADVVEGAHLHGLHGRRDGGIAGDDDHHRIRTPAFHGAQRFQAAGAGQLEIEEHDVNVLGVEHLVGVLRAIGDEGVEAGGLRRIAAAFANGAFVVHHQQVEQVGAGNLTRPGQYIHASNHDSSLPRAARADAAAAAAGR